MSITLSLRAQRELSSSVRPSAVTSMQSGPPGAGYESTTVSVRRSIFEIVFSARFDKNTCRPSPNGMKLWAPLPVTIFLTFVRARPHPLALYWFDHDAARTERALQSLEAGGVTVNDTLLHLAQDSLPFGGVGTSGMGAYHGQWGFDTFSHLKPVFRQSRLNGIALFLPPYRPLMRRLLALMKRH